MLLVTLDELKSYLRIDGTQDDVRLQLILDGITDQVSSFCGFEFGVVTAQSDSVDGGGESLVLSLYPVTAITSITDNVTGDVIDSGTYRLSASDGIIINKYGCWESGKARFTVVYSGGMPVPNDVRLAVLIWCGKIEISGRGFTSEKMGDASYSVPDGIPAEVEKTLSRYRVIKF